MFAAATAPPTFSDKELVRLLETLRGADSVEVKLTVPGEQETKTRKALEYFARARAEENS
jgi:hypothetical protein